MDSNDDKKDVSSSPVADTWRPREPLLPHGWLRKNVGCFVFVFLAIALFAFSPMLLVMVNKHGFRQDLEQDIFRGEPLPADMNLDFPNNTRTGVFTFHAKESEVRRLVRRLNLQKVDSRFAEQMVHVPRGCSACSGFMDNTAVQVYATGNIVPLQSGRSFSHVFVFFNRQQQEACFEGSYGYS